MNKVRGLLKQLPTANPFQVSIKFFYRVLASLFRSAFKGLRVRFLSINGIFRGLAFKVLLMMIDSLKLKTCIPGVSSSRSTSGCR